MLPAHRADRSRRRGRRDTHRGAFRERLIGLVVRTNEHRLVPATDGPDGAACHKRLECVIRTAGRVPHPRDDLAGARAVYLIAGRVPSRTRGWLPRIRPGLDAVSRPCRPGVRRTLRLEPGHRLRPDGSTDRGVDRPGLGRRALRQLPVRFGLAGRAGVVGAGMRLATERGPGGSSWPSAASSCS